MKLEILLADETATVALGRQLGRLLSEGQAVYLEGTLGAGKTTMTRGILQSWGHSGPVKSPTYTLVEPYELSGRTFYHFDLYRLGDPEELEYLGLRDYFSNSALCLVEWPSKGAGFLPEPDIRIELAPKGTGRLATLNSFSNAGQSVLEQLKT